MYRRHRLLRKVGRKTMSLELDASCLRRLSVLLCETRRIRIPRVMLWAAYARAFPNRPQGPEEREWVAQALADRAEQGDLRLPAARGRGWDRSAIPPIPLFVQLNVAPSPTPDRAW